MSVTTAACLTAILALLRIVGGFALLWWLGAPGWAGGFLNHDAEIDGDYAPGFGFLVLSEDDVDHYAQRLDPPGQMRQQTEAFVREHGGWSKTEG